VGQQVSPLIIYHNVATQGVKRPVVQKQDMNRILLEQPNIPKEWLRRQPVYQVQVVRPGVKGVSREAQYVLQPVLPSILSVNKQVEQKVGGLSQVVVPQKIQTTSHSILHLVKQDDGISMVKKDQDLRPVQVVSGVEDVQRVADLSKTSAKKTAQNKVIIEETQRHVPVVSGQRVIGYQLIGGQPQIQSQIQRQVLPQVRQQSVQYVPYIVQQIPSNNVQQYYQVMQSMPLQYGQQQDDSQLISYSGQPSISDQLPLQYSIQDPSSVEQSGIDMLSTQVDQAEKQVQGSVQGIQGVQKIQNLSVQDQTADKLKGQDLRVNPLLVQQRSHILTQMGVKGTVNV